MYYKGHPKLYFRRKKIFWWTTKWTHFRFILRELTSLAVAYFAVCLIVLIPAVSSGRVAYEALMGLLRHPALIVINVVALALLLYHSFTWFNLAPKAMVIRIGKMHVPAALIAGANYGAWIILSIGVLWVLMK